MSRDDLIFQAHVERKKLLLLPNVTPEHVLKGIFLIFHRFVFDRKFAVTVCFFFGVPVILCSQSIFLTITLSKTEGNHCKSNEYLRCKMSAT